MGALHNDTERRSQARAAVVSFSLLVVAARGSLAAEPMSPSQILQIARSGLGHAYHWGHGDWTTDGTSIGSCSPNTGSTGCPRCTPVGTYGADCSGFVAKAWQVPSPSPVEQEAHPYSTLDFMGQQPHWAALPDRSDIRRGDALAYSRTKLNAQGQMVREGHIVLIDRVLSGGYYQVLEAAGCRQGIIQQSRLLDKRFEPRRRNDLLEETCTAQSCGGHGVCRPDATCECDMGYAGDHCERCVEGFSGYPTCVQGTCPTVVGSLKCGDTVAVQVFPEPNSAEGYSCGAEGMGGGDQAFAFSPFGAGRAIVRVESQEEVPILLLRNECSPESACAGTSTEAVEFGYGAGDSFYIVLDTEEPLEATVTLSVECVANPVQWVGSSCSQDTDCSVGTNWRCYKQPGQDRGFCTLPCGGSCPELPNTAHTFCIPDPADTGRGLCVSQADRLNDQCRSVAGTAAGIDSRFRRPADKAQVCRPSADACLSGFSGRVVDHASRQGIAGAVVHYAAPGVQGTLGAGADGAFTSEALACGDYQVSVEAPGYLPASLALALGGAQSRVQLIELRALAEDCAGTPADFSSYVRDGGSGAALGGAVLELHRGVDAPLGELVATLATEEDGSVEGSGIDGGYYTLVASAAGYHASSPRTVSLCGGTSQVEADFYLVPDSNEPVTFALSWTSPPDLDLHLQLPNGEEVFFDQCAGDLAAFPFAHLDFDHRQADGPEGIVLRSLVPGTYTLFVHNYSAHNDGASPSWAGTEAVVEAFDVATGAGFRFVAPPGEGLFWDVLSFEGAGRPLTFNGLNRLRDDRANTYDEYTRQCRP